MAPEDVELGWRSDQRFRLLVDSVVDYAIFLLDPDGHVTSWNTGAARLKGYTADEVVGHHYSLFYPEESIEQGRPQRLLDQAREGGRASDAGWRVRKDGTRFWADVVLTALTDEGGAVTGFAKVTRDRTADRELAEQRERALEEQRRLVSRLEELDAWRRDFMSSVAHDLQTPVTAIHGFVTLLRDGVSSEELPIVIDSVLANAGSLQEFVDNLRSYTVLAERDPPLDLRAVELSRFLSRLVAASAPLLDGRPVEVEMAEGEVVADRHGLERIVRNLLTNAARHTPEGTKVTLRARVDETSRIALLEVADDGPGIAPHLLPRVFERFERGGGGGTGLGLAIARRWTELHGGSISVDSTVGVGTTFRVELPIDPPSAAQDDPSDEPPA